MSKVYYSSVLFLVLLISFGCNKQDEQTQQLQQFELLDKDITGLDFENVLTQTKEFNVFSYMYFFNGAGVGAGDFNNDGKIDLYFASNMSSSKLFLNQGEMEFTDVTEKAGVQGMGGWSTGVSVVDINNDGLLDIYLNQVGDFKVLKGRNRLYINKGIEDGIPVFEDQAEEYGLSFVGFSTQSVFFDYDLDGDLDMFQLNHSVHENGTFGERESFIGKEHATSGDRLYRNDNGRYVDITEKSGIHSLVIGYGLGVVVGDVNNDGWPDIYIGNDFHENDYLYINQQDGTFREKLNEQMMHTSRFSMGVEMADVNNDGLNDIFSLDMQPYDPVILKSSLGEDDNAIFNFKLKYGYNVQFARNNLQLNNGNSTFSEIGMFANVHATDWSWASLFLDFDHDGYKDLFVSNGIPRRMNDIDYVNFRESNEDHKWKTQANHVEDEDLFYIDQIPQIKIPNKFLRNTGELQFIDIEKTINGSRDTYSNGAIYADLDNDGDLDIVVNNINDSPFIYKNLTSENNKQDRNFLSLKFKGNNDNINGIGARVLIYKAEEQLIFENFPVRGFQSTVEAGIHAGIGDTTAVDSILVVWPDRTYENITGKTYNQTHTITWRENLPKFTYPSRLPDSDIEFKDLTENSMLTFNHAENEFVEFDRERLVPFMVSTEGPALAVGDINGDSLDDIFFGSSKRERSAIFFQKTDGTFDRNTSVVIANDSVFEDVDAVFADIDNDGDLDLAVASGGNEYWGESEFLKQRIYVNDGTGKFTERITLKDAYMTGSCVVAADFDGDGLVDLFFGGRAEPKNYGITPRSYLFKNNGDGKFEDVTKQFADGLADIGMVRDAEWSDIDKDGDPDLILAVEWDAITIFLNEVDSFERLKVGTQTGWWSFVLSDDFDGDGDMDILAGNVGKNAKFKPTPEEPVRLYIEDFDNNGQIDQVLTYYVGGREIPFANYSELTKQMPFLRKKYLYAKDFASASIKELFGSQKINESAILEVNTLENAYFENTGDLEFKMHALPPKLQFSSVRAGASFEKAGMSKGVILAGNFYDNNVEMGRYDANYGNVISIEENGNINVQGLGALNIKGQVRRIVPITINGQQAFAFARNNGAALILQPVQNTLITSRK